MSEVEIMARLAKLVATARLDAAHLSVGALQEIVCAAAQIGADVMKEKAARAVAGFEREVRLYQDGGWVFETQRASDVVRGIP